VLTANLNERQHKSDGTQIQPHQIAADFIIAHNDLNFNVEKLEGLSNNYESATGFIENN
jgi:hypothetical protein